MKKKQVRSGAVMFRVTKEEKKLIQAAAKANGYRVLSDYMRKVLFGK